MSTDKYDYAIVGAGAAGLHLALAMLDQSYFDDKRILIFDKDSKDRNDKTWSYWEVGKGRWDNIIQYEWKSALFYKGNHNIEMDLKPYRYKQIRSLDFYRYALDRILVSNNIEFIKEKVDLLNETENNVEIITNKACYTVGHCFDGRICPAFKNHDDGFIRILQHFNGWTISFENPVFDSSNFTMMDFRASIDDNTSFMYVLPVSEKKALVEFTFFTEQAVKRHVYENSIVDYIQRYISSEPYEILEKEKGVIPMTDFPFHKYSSLQITKIGTAGSWVRSSTGYSFKNAERNARTIVHNIESNRPIEEGILKKKAMWYDTILLDILKHENNLGPEIFRQLYARNKIGAVLKFLDGETSLLEDVRIIFSLNPLPFLRAVGRCYFKSKK